MRREKACDWRRVTGERNETNPWECLDNNSNNDKKEEEEGEDEKARVPSQSPALVPTSLYSTSDNVRVNPACQSEYTVRAHRLKISSDVGGFGSSLWDASYHRILHVRPRKRGAEEHCEKIPLVPIFWNRKQNAGTLGIHAKHSRSGPPGLTVPPLSCPSVQLRRTARLQMVMQSCRTCCHQDSADGGVYFWGVGSRFWVLTLP